MSKKYLQIVTLTVCSFAMSDVFAAGDCKTNDCYCGMGIQNKRDKEKFETTCYTAANKKVKVYDGFGDSRASEKNCLTKCLGLDAGAVIRIMANQFSPESKKVLKADPK